MKLTKRKILYVACAVIVIICIAISNIRNSQPYTGLWGFNGGSPSELVIKELTDKGFRISQTSPLKVEGINPKGHVTHWSLDKWGKVECTFNQSGKLTEVTLITWNKLNYAPSLIKELEKTFGKSQNGETAYTGNNFYLFGNPLKTHATLNASDIPPFTTLSIKYKVGD